MTKVMHQIWIGPPNAECADNVQEWRSACERAGWRHVLWNDKGLADLEMLPSSRALYERFLAAEIWCGAADVARIEALCQFGGVYLDADMALRAFIDDAPFINSALWISESPHTKGRPQNAAMGVSSSCAILEEYRAAFAGVVELQPAWQRSGVGLLEPILARHPGEFYLVPSPAFHPRQRNGKPNPEAASYTGPVYADHQFATTKNKKLKR